MKKKSTDISQQTLEIFQPLEEWPKGYHKFIESHTAKVIGMDIETEGLSPYHKNARIISVGVSPKEKIAFSTYTLKYNDWDLFSLKAFQRMLADPNVILVGHNIKYDINWIAQKFVMPIRCMLFDTMFAQYLVDENIESNSLGYLTEQYEDLKGYKDKVNRKKLNLMSKDDVLLYQCKDADGSRRLYDYFVPKLKQGGYDKLMTTASMVLPVLSKMETRGVYLDREYANKTKIKLFNELVSNRVAMAEISNHPFDPDSYQSLGKTLYSTMGFTPKKFTDKGSPSTDGEAIAYLVDQATTKEQNSFLDRLIEYKKKVKLITTYYQPIDRWLEYDGRVHTEYSLGKQNNDEAIGGTVTGRLSSRNPNLQNIPRGKEHRGMFKANEGYTLLDGDFSQLELRVAAFLSQEPVMIDAFNNGLDIHSAVMADLTGVDYASIQTQKEENEKIKNDRVAIKRVNFGILYGVQARRLQRLLRVELGIHQEMDYCRRLIQQWLSKYVKVAQWIEAQKVQASVFKYVDMPLGQRRRLPNAGSDSPEGYESLRQATNFPVQSFASWICLIGLIILDNYFQEYPEIGGHLIMQVHDSVTAEIKLQDDRGNLTKLDLIKQDVKQIMERETLNYLREVFGINFNVPLVFDVKISERWS